MYPPPPSVSTDPPLRSMEGFDAVIDCNYAGNIADAVYHVHQRLHQQGSREDLECVGGQMYYYTGEHHTNAAMNEYMRAATGKPTLALPLALVQQLVIWWSWARLDPNKYSFLDMLLMGRVEQTFDNSKFFRAFPGFQERVSMAQAVQLLFKK